MTAARWAGLLGVLVFVQLLVIAGCSAEPGGVAEETVADGGGEAAGSTGPAEDRAHPDFDLSRSELYSLMSEVAGADLAAVAATPEYFLELLGRVLRLPEARLALVDKQIGLPEGYVPDDLVRAADYPLVVNRADMLLREVIMPDLVAMSVAARIDGVVLDISSGYRSYEYQAGLFQRHVANLGIEQAKRESAEPGHSQHQLGTTVDFGSITPAFADTSAGQWLARNAWRYGFSLSYPDGLEELTGYVYESWHFRFLGREATEMEQQFFRGMQQYFLEFLAENRSQLSPVSGDSEAS